MSSYGTTTNNSANNGGNGRADEETTLLGKPKGKSLTARTVKHFGIEVRRDWADVVLLLCYIITGLLDSSAISIYTSFVSMQTGNTVYIGLGLAAPSESTRWIKSACSLASFCIGSVFFSRFHRYFSPKRRWVLCVSFATQMILIVAAAAIVTVGPKPGKDEISWYVLVPIALVAFQSCGQAVTSRALKYNALTSVVLTSIYCDLFSDAELFSFHNTERNRRVAAPLLLLFGAICGGLFAHSRFGIAGAFWTAAVLKFLVVISWFVWPGETEDDED